MTGPTFDDGGQFNQPPGDPAGGSAPDAARRQRRFRLGLIVGGIIVLAIIGLGIANLAGAFDSSASAGPDLNRSDPTSTATVFVERYAVHDPTACELLDATLEPKFQRDGRCSGTPLGTYPRVDVINSRTCGNRHNFDAEVNPAGEIGKRYVSIGLEETDGQWSVRAVLPISDRSVLRDAACAPPSTTYGS